MTSFTLQFLQQDSVSIVFITPRTGDHNLTIVVPYPVVLHNMETTYAKTVVPTFPPVLQPLMNDGTVSTSASPHLYILSFERHTTTSGCRSTRLRPRVLVALFTPVRSLVAADLSDLVKLLNALFPTVLPHGVDGDPTTRFVVISRI